MCRSRPVAPVDLVIVGHLARNEDRTPAGTRVSDGGSAYYAAVGATVIAPERVGLIAPVGTDFDWTALARLHVNVEGVAVVEGRTPRFTITQRCDGSRSFTPDWGVAAEADRLAIPPSYSSARYVHLATAPPLQQLHWLDRLHELPHPPLVSIDTFEHFAEAFPAESRKVCELADLVFMNESEGQMLGQIAPCRPGGATVMKRGARGARYVQGEITYEAPIALASVPVVDTTGAGDMLAGAFLALRSVGVDIRAALRQAVVIASASVVDFGVDGLDVQAALAHTRQLVTAHRRPGA